MPSSMLQLAIPLLHVSNSRAAEDFYTKGLGFHCFFVHRPDGRDDPAYLALSRDRIAIHLSSHSGDAVPGGVANILVDDVDALFAEFKSRGVRIDLEPTDQTWGTREMYVKDADGNCLRFQQEGRRSSDSDRPG